MSTEIKYEEIQRGDTIRIIFSEAGGITHSCEGTVFKQLSSSRWETIEGRVLITDLDSVFKIELLDRPTPSLPTVPGTVFRATKVRGVECDVVVFVRLSIVTGLVYVTSDFVGGFFDHHPTHITEWEEI